MSGKDISLTRRGFMGGAAVTLAAMGAARGQEEKKEKVKAGVVGQGGRGTMISQMLQEHGGYDIVALADYFPDVVNAAGERFGVPTEKCFSGLDGYKRVIDGDVDAVFLETPPYCFPEHTQYAVDAGRHVFIAKPLGCDVPGCLAIEKAGKQATQNDQVFLVDFQTRTDPLYIEAIDRVRAGEWGKIGLLTAVYADEAFPDPPLTDTIESRLQHLVWVNDTALGGGYLGNAGIHAVDVALWLAGEQPIDAVGSSRRMREEAHGDSHDVYSLTYRFPSGLVLSYRGEHMRNRFGFVCECFAHCQDGYLETGYTGKVAVSGIHKNFPGGEVEALYKLGAERNIDAFHKSVLEGDYSNATIQPGVDATLASILGREAAKRNGRLTWEEMLQENARLEVDLSGLKR